MGVNTAMGYQESMTTTKNPQHIATWLMCSTAVQLLCYDFHTRCILGEFGYG